MINHDMLLRKLSIICFPDDSIRFQSYLSNRIFSVNLENSFSEILILICGIPRGSLLGPLLFLIYFNDIQMGVKCNLLLHVDDTSLVFQSDNVIEIKKQVNLYFSNMCVDSKLCIQFGDETKYIFFCFKT